MMKSRIFYVVGVIFLILGSCNNGEEQTDYNVDLNSIVPAHGTLNPVFNNAVTNYNLNLQYDVDNITFTAETADSNTIIIFDPPEAENGKSGVILTEGNPVKVNIKVIAPDNTSKIYTINIIRNPLITANNITLTLGTIFINNEEIADGTNYAIRVYESANSTILLGDILNSVYTKNNTNTNNISLYNYFSGVKTLYLKLTIGTDECPIMEKSVNFSEPTINLGDLNFYIFTLNISVDASINYSDIIRTTGIHVIDSERKISFSTYLPENVHNGNITRKFCVDAVPFDIEVYISFRTFYYRYFYSESVIKTINADTTTVNFDMNVNLNLIKLSGTLGNITLNGSTPHEWLEHYNRISVTIFDQNFRHYFNIIVNSSWETYIESQNNDILASMYIDFNNFEKYENTSRFRYYFDKTINISNSDITDIDLGDMEFTASEINGTVKENNKNLDTFTIAALSEKITSAEIPLNRNTFFIVSINESNGNWYGLIPDTVPSEVWFFVHSNGRYFITHTTVPVNGTTLDIAEMIELWLD